MRPSPNLAFVTAVFTVFSACGGSKAPTAPPVAEVDIPSLLDKPIWDDELKEPTAIRLLDTVKKALADGLPLLEGTDSAAWSGPLKDFINRRIELGKQIRDDIETLVGHSDARFKLFAAINFGVFGDDLVTDLTSISLPPEVLKDEYGAEIAKAFRDAMEDKAAEIADRARGALQKCVELAPQAASLMRAWEPYCRERDAKLAELEARVAARAGARPAHPKQPAASAEPPVLADCKPKEPHMSSRPKALPPDRKVKPSVAFIYEGSEVTGEDVAKLEAAVAAKLGKSTGMPIVNGKEVAAARALVKQKKLHAKGPVCGVAPPLTAVVAHKRKHLVIGEIVSTCVYDDVKAKPRCGLLVDFMRAGADDHDGLPASHFAPVAKRDVPAADYIAAAAELAPDQASAGVLGGLVGSEWKPYVAEFSGYADEDAWLTVGWKLQYDTTERLKACVDTAASFDATFTITKEGATKDVTLTPITAPAAGTKVTDCVRKALEETPGPCTRDGKPAKVAVRACVAPRP
jgi:hypothetical protein